MVGGYGDDIYVVRDLGDVVSEAWSQGTDTVLAVVNSHTLAEECENLTFIGAGDFTGAGNARDNLIESSSGNDALDGGAGSDYLFAAAGNDSLSGGSGEDSLDGGQGSDLLSGGSGNDVYGVDSAGDTVSEASGNGIDLVVAFRSSYALTGNVENLIFAGTGANQNFKGVGNGSQQQHFVRRRGDTLMGLPGPTPSWPVRARTRSTEDQA